MASVCKPQVCLNLMSMIVSFSASNSRVKLQKMGKLQEARKGKCNLQAEMRFFPGAYGKQDTHLQTQVTAFITGRPKVSILVQNPAASWCKTCALLFLAHAHQNPW